MVNPDPPIDNGFIKLLLDRFGYGPLAEDYVMLPRQGLNAWLEEQTAAPEGDDADIQKRLSSLQYRITFKGNDKYDAIDEMRPLQYLDKPIEAAWPLLDPASLRDGAEKRRPRDEVIAATCIRARYSKYQLHEAMTAFWHDHFNVNTNGGDQIAVSFAVYDRDVIRKNALGNFRDMLEAVATSTAMQYYLSNHSSRAGAANENYARELFELHTLGRDAYLNDQYDRWRDVPGALIGKPEGYIDQDVYEAARAFTGWTIEDGAGLDGQRKLSSTGKFIYVEGWHDGYQKRVLAQDFDPFKPAMADGREVLDLIAHHPATARYITKKLCLRFIGPNFSAALHQQLAAQFQKLVTSPKQIAEVIKTIIHSKDFAASGGAKVKRPLTLAMSFLRITHTDFTPTEAFVGGINNAGQKMFVFPTPNGPPDNNEYYLSTNNIRHRWNLLLALAQNNWQTGAVDPLAAAPMATSATAGDFIQRWLDIFATPPGNDFTGVIADASGLQPGAAIHGADPKKLAKATAIAAMSPYYQTA